MLSRTRSQTGPENSIQSKLLGILETSKKWFSHWRDCKIKESQALEKVFKLMSKRLQNPPRITFNGIPRAPLTRIKLASNTCLKMNPIWLPKVLQNGGHIQDLFEVFRVPGSVWAERASRGCSQEQKAAPWHPNDVQKSSKSFPRRHQWH